MEKCSILFCFLPQEIYLSKIAAALKKHVILLLFEKNRFQQLIHYKPNKY